MKRILVTGGNGFIGSHIVKRLREDDNEVISYTNDIRVKFLENRYYDEIYNFASTPSPSKFTKHLIKTIETNTEGVSRLLRSASINKAKFFQASTVSVYGNIDIPQYETRFGGSNPWSKRAVYDEGKRVAETLCYAYQEQLKVDIRIARLGDCYGPGMSLDHGGVITTFIKQALRNEDIVIFGSGDNIRTYCYIDDTVDGIMKLMESNINVPVNIASTQFISITNLAKVVIELCDSKSDIIYKGSLENDIDNRLPDITMAQDKLGWSWKMALRDGLKETIKYIKGVVDDNR